MCLQLSSRFKSQCVFSHQPSSQKICTKFWFTKFWSIKLIEPSWNPRQETRKILSSDPNCKYLGFKTSVKYLHIIEWEKIRTGLSQYYFDNDFQHANANGIDLNEHLVFTPVQGRQGWIWLRYAICSMSLVQGRQGWIWLRYAVCLH